MKHFIDLKKLACFITLLILTICFILAGGYAAFADEIQVVTIPAPTAEQTTFQKPDFNYSVNNNFDETLSPANLGGNQFVGKCDSDAVKKRAHKWGLMGYQKQLDVQMQGKCYSTCELIAKTSANDAVTCIRECGDQQREQRKDAANGITNSINAAGLGLQVIKGFSGKF